MLMVIGEFRLHALTAEEILKEGGVRKEAEMRHFTGTYAIDVKLPTI